MKVPLRNEIDGIMYIFNFTVYYYCYFEFYKQEFLFHSTPFFSQVEVQIVLRVHKRASGLQYQ